MKAYESLEKHFRRLSHFEHLGAMAHWDMAVIMPEGGAEARAAALAELAGFMVESLSDPKVSDWLGEASVKASELSPWQQANLREMQRQCRNLSSVDQDLVEKKSLAGARCEQAWRQYRVENNFKDFAPLLSEVVELTREEARQRAAATGLSTYDALLDLYEPGASSESITKIFSETKAFLKDFLPQVLEKQKSEDVIRPQGPFAIEKQRDLGLELMKVVGYDFKHGRLDVSHHPFSGGVPTDSRITTRYSEEDFTESLMGVLHESGHASYEQNLPVDWLSQPVGSARGMGIHESQSLLFEMQVARGAEFLEFATPLMQKHLGNASGATSEWSVENIQRLYTRVKPDFIRVNADEVTYPAHVILRFEIEQDLMSRDLEVKDLPEVWNTKMVESLGVSTEGNYKDGCMQDIHWTDGSFGYFPTYTLGAMNAAQIYKKALETHPEISIEILAGDFSTLRTWLTKNIWSQASFYDIDGLMKAATGETLNPKYFMNHLKARYL